MTTSPHASTLRPALAVAVLLTLALAFFWFRPAPEIDPQTLVDRPMPAFAIAPAGPGMTGLSQSDLTGRVTLVNFFATWCGPCRGEHPALIAAKRRGLAIIGISQDDRAEAVTRFLSEHGNPYTRVALDEVGRASHAFGVSGIPQSYLVDSRGVIRFVWAGPITPEVLTREILPRAAALSAPPKQAAPADDSKRAPAL